MKKHPVWTYLNHRKGDHATIHTIRDNGTHRTYTGTVLGWTADNRLAISIPTTENGTTVTKKYGIWPKDAVRYLDHTRAEANRERRANAPKATDAQIIYAEGLLVRVGVWGWRHTSLGHTPMPTVDDLRAMTKHEISDLIDTLKIDKEWA